MGGNSVPKGVAIGVIVVIILMFAGAIVAGFFLFRDSTPRESIQIGAAAAIMAAAEEAGAIIERSPYAEEYEPEETALEIVGQDRPTPHEAYVMIMSQLAPSPGQSAQFDFDFFWESVTYYDGEVFMDMTMEGNMRMITDGERTKTALYLVLGILDEYDFIQLFTEQVGDGAIFARFIEGDYEEEFEDFFSADFFDILNFVYIPYRYWGDFIIAETVTQGFADDIIAFHIEIPPQILVDLGVLEIIDMFDMGHEILHYHVTIVLNANGEPIEMHTDMMMSSAWFGEEHTIQHFFFNNLGDGVVIEIPR